MRTCKRVLCPQRLRKPPARFSWVDHRLVRDRYICRCGPEALALYLLLVTVGDAEGLSYYADPTVAELLSMTPAGVAAARRELVQAGLLAYQRPLYQVLSLPEPAPSARLPDPEPRGGRPRTVAEIIGRMMEEQT
jgi:hypothetical protein